MLAICLKVFPDNGTIFSLRYRDCKNICDDSEAFMQFLDFYHVSYESDEKYAPSANINKNGIVSLSVLNKDGRGIIWDGESFLLQHFSKDVVYRFGIETVSLHAFAELLSLDPSQSFISYHTLKCYKFMAKTHRLACGMKAPILHLFVSTVRLISEATVIKYIEEQKTNGC